MRATCFICNCLLPAGGSLCRQHDGLATLWAAVHAGVVSDWPTLGFRHDLAMTLPPVTTLRYGWRQQLAELWQTKRLDERLE